MKRENLGRRLTAKADAAFEPASRMVIERAVQTRTPVVVWKDGQVVLIPTDQLELPTRRPKEHK